MKCILNSRVHVERSNGLHTSLYKNIPLPFSTGAPEDQAASGGPGTAASASLPKHPHGDPSHPGHQQDGSQPKESRPTAVVRHVQERRRG